MERIQYKTAMLELDDIVAKVSNISPDKIHEAGLSKLDSRLQEQMNKILDDYMVSEKS